MAIPWQYYSLKAASAVISCLPHRAVLVMSRWLGAGYYHVAAKQRRRARKQIEERLGLTPAESEHVIRRMFVHIAQNFLEVLYTPALCPDNIGKLVHIENAHYLAEAHALGRGVVFLTAHIGNWEWLGAALAMAGFPMTSVIRRQLNDQHTRLLNEYREKVGLEIYARGSAEMVGAAKALRKGKILGFLSDQDAGVNGVFIEFLGKMAATPTGAAVFARKFSSPVVASFIVHRPDGGHRVIIHPPMFYEDTGDEAADLYALNVKMTQTIEQTIREYPDDWIWFLKRWNTPYPGAANGDAAGK